MADTCVRGHGRHLCHVDGHKEKRLSGHGLLGSGRVEPSQCVGSGRVEPSQCVGSGRVEPSQCVWFR